MSQTHSPENILLTGSLRSLLGLGAFQQMGTPVLSRPWRRRRTEPRDLRRQKEAGRQKRARRATRARGR